MKVNIWYYWRSMNCEQKSLEIKKKNSWNEIGVRALRQL